MSTLRNRRAQLVDLLIHIGPVPPEHLLKQLLEKQRQTHAILN